MPNFWERLKESLDPHDPKYDVANTKDPTLDRPSVVGLDERIKAHKDGRDNEPPWYVEESENSRVGQVKLEAEDRIERQRESLAEILSERASVLENSWIADLDHLADKAQVMDSYRLAAQTLNGMGHDLFNEGLIKEQFWIDIPAMEKRVEQAVHERETARQMESAEQEIAPGMYVNRDQEMVFRPIENQAETGSSIPRESRILPRDDAQHKLDSKLENIAHLDTLDKEGLRLLYNAQSRDLWGDDRAGRRDAKHAIAAEIIERFPDSQIAFNAVKKFPDLIHEQTRAMMAQYGATVQMTPIEKDRSIPTQAISLDMSA